ncbi:hypothetical protein SD71_13265 [Cohnella kolymensis]|uniref:J domain-containing protein n=1 Tax=Cohnella kolymensis TaxID=1590652 RepID=A0ABR5A398_9BACL|nr:J domain-containing protein [Cohnella kolymensis]KIL35480.1 hypothetical protein SD71_13265 [Cohnella kolymensis]
MDSFQILGIDPTTDIKLIKRAYSRMLQIYSPETDPEGFQKLREAYEQAVSSIHSDNNSTSKSLSTVDEFMNSFEAIYNDYGKRLNMGAWKEILEQDVCYQIDSSTEVSSRILGFLTDRFYLPHQIWVLFDSYFAWSAIRQGYTRNLIRISLILSYAE